MGKIGYKNGLQVSVGHLRVPGAGIEPARIAPLVFETSASTDSAIRAGALYQLPVGTLLDRLRVQADEAVALARTEREC